MYRYFVFVSYQRYDKSFGTQTPPVLERYGDDLEELQDQIENTPIDERYRAHYTIFDTVEKQMVWIKTRGYEDESYLEMIRFLDEFNARSNRLLFKVVT